MGRQVFTAGEILTAANMNDLSDQSVMVFDDATARTTAIPTPVEGMVTYLKDDDEVTVFDGSVFKAVGPGQILQVVSTLKTNAFSASVAARPTISGAVTGLTATITPSSASSKVLILVSVAVATDSSNNGVFVHLFKDGAVSGFAGDAAGNRQRASRLEVLNNITQVVAPITFLDSPNTTSAVTYDIRLSHDLGTSANVFVNRSEDDPDANINGRGASSITVMEVAG